MKNFKKLFLIILCVSIMFSLNACGAEKKEMSFDDYLQKQFVESVTNDSISLHFTLKNPEKYGINNIKPTLGKIDMGEFEKLDNKINQSLKELSNFKYGELTDNQKITYDILKQHLTLQQKGKGLSYYSEVASPLNGMQSQLPNLLPEYKFYVKNDIDDYIGLLNDIDNCFDDIINFEKEKSKQGLFMADFVADKIINQCNDFAKEPEKNVLINSFNEKIDAFKGISDSEKQTYKENNKKAVLDVVIPAYSKLATELSKLKGTGKNDGGLCNLPKGKQYYEYLVATKTGSSKTVNELGKMIDKNLSAQKLVLSSLMMKNSNLISEYENAKFDVIKPVEILEALKKRMVNDYPKLNDVSYEVKQVPKSLEASTSPAFYLIPPIDAPTENTIYVNNSEEYAHMSLFTTLAHEGYPGHLYQTNYFHSTNPNPIRAVLDFPGYVEGWATYVESQSLEFANFDNDALVKFMQIDRTLSLAISSRVDIGVNYEGWDKKKIKNYLESFGLGSDEITEQIFESVVEEPANYLSYFIGYLEIIELQDYAKDRLNDKFVLTDFNKAILDVGPAQFSVVKKEIDKYINTK